MLLKMKIRATHSKLFLIQELLAEEGIQAEIRDDTLYVEKEANLCYFNEEKMKRIFEQIKELQVEEMEIGAYTIRPVLRYPNCISYVPIYHFSFQKEEGV